MSRASPIALAILSLGLTTCSSSEPPPGVVEQPDLSEQPQLPDSSLQHYIAAQLALAADDYSEARRALQQLAGEAAGEIEVLAEQAVQTEDIGSLRAAFKPLSDEIIGRALPEDYAVVFCPMADQGQGAHWVQRDGEVKNPYFGSAMLTCGSIIK